MTQRTNSNTTVPDIRSCVVALAVSAVAFSLLLAGAGITAAQTTQPTVSVSSATTTVDGTTTVEIVLTEAPDGLSGYYLDLTVSDPEVATVTSASYPDEFGLTADPTIDTDGQTVTLEAADMEGSISPGATDVTLATVEVTSQAAGEIELAVEPQQFDTDDGDRLRPETQPGVVTIGVDGGDTDSSDASGADGSAAGSDGETTGDSYGLGGFSGSTVVFAGAVLAAVGSLAAAAIARQRS